jgi:hypothetical protein
MDGRMRLQIAPIKDIEDAYKNKDFFRAFILATAYFEYETNLILGTFFEDRISPQVLGYWSFKSKIKLLFGLDLIDRSTHDKISQITKIRNKLVHPVDIWEDKGRRMRDIFLRYRLREEEKTLLLSFDDCYGKLTEAHLRVLTEKSKEQ